jgi:drug/metabolite transporter (DMT)-like permease
VRLEDFGLSLLRRLDDRMGAASSLNLPGVMPGRHGSSAAPPLLLTTLVGRQAWRGLSRGRALAATLLALAAMCGVLLAGAFTIFTSSASLGLASGVGGAMALVVYSLLLPALVAVDDPRVAWTIASGFAIAAVPIAWWVQLLANLA